MLELPTEDWSTYRRRLKDEHAAGWLTHAWYLVLKAIADLNAAGCWNPTVAKISLDAGVNVRTVRRARKGAQARGLLLVQPQYVRVDGRPQQRANRYELALPAAPVLPKPRKLRGGQTGRAIGKKEERRPVLKGPDLLLARRHAFIAGQLAARNSDRTAKCPK